MCHCFKRLYVELKVEGKVMKVVESFQTQQHRMST